MSHGSDIFLSNIEENMLGTFVDDPVEEMANSSLDREGFQRWFTHSVFVGFPENWKFY